MPVKSAENHTIIAFAKIGDDKVLVADHSYEVDVPADRLAAGVKVPLPPEAVAQLRTPTPAMATILESRPVSIKAL